MLKDISIGQYVPGNSFLHSSDPRSKLICMFVYIVLIFCTFNYYSLIIMLSVTVVCVLVSGFDGGFLDGRGYHFLFF